MIRAEEFSWWIVVGLVGVFALAVTAPAIGNPVSIVEPGAEEPAEDVLDDPLLSEFGLAAEPTGPTEERVPIIWLALGVTGLVVLVLIWMFLGEIRQTRGGGLGFLLFFGVLIGLGLMVRGHGRLPSVAPVVSENFPAVMAILSVILAVIGMFVLINRRGMMIRTGEKVLNFVGDSETEGDDGSDAWHRFVQDDVTPSENAVYESWHRMATAVADDEVRPETARIVLETAAKRGLDRDAASELTALFEAVRYGNREPNPERERRAGTLLSQLGLEEER